MINLGKRFRNVWLKRTIKHCLLILGICCLCSLLIVVTSGNNHAVSAQSIDPLKLHVLNRLSFGPRPGDIEHIQNIGIDAYIQEQLSPQSIKQSSELQQKLDRIPTFNLSAVQMLRTHLPKPKEGKKLSLRERRQFRRRSRNIKVAAIKARLLQATESPKQLEEVMVDFWFNHFNVYANKRLNNLLIGSYDDRALRPYALGNFRDLLFAAAKHPAMLSYLDNISNQAPHPRHPKWGINENYARELLELHTLGVEGGYTQADVIALAKILTGWQRMPSKQLETADLNDNGFYFNPKTHDFSDKIFLNQKIMGSGEAEGDYVLELLARHPATARHISYKLAQYFVSDNPPETLVKQLSQVFLASNGNIKTVLETLFHSQEFRDPRYFHQKFKTPYQFVISAIRAANLSISHTSRLNGILEQMSMEIYGCLSPNGYPNTASFWLNPDALLRRLDFSQIMARKNIPFLTANSSDTLPLRKQDLYKTLGHAFSDNTHNVITDSPTSKQAMLIFGSPEFMYR